MKIQLVSHASVIVETADTAILTDPWIFGQAFNDSWSLLFEPVMTDDDLKKVDYLWISHEHPDHLHFPTLKSLPEEFKERVTVLFQNIPSKNVVNSLRNIAGFKNIIELSHRQHVQLTEKTQVYCYHSRQVDSALAVLSDGKSILNINDVEASPKDRQILRRDLGEIDCVLNQFSVAGYSGDVNYAKLIPAANQRIIQNMILDSQAVGAKFTIPFASFIYFCCEDNKYINQYANTPRVVYDAFHSAGMHMKVLKPGEEWDLDDVPKSGEALAWYDEKSPQISELPIAITEQVKVGKIEKAFNARMKQLRRNYPNFFLRLVKPVIIHIPDLDQTIRISLAIGQFERLGSAEDFDLEIYSQPLWYGFKYPWGIQTLGVSGRLRLHKNGKYWRRLRYLMAMNNAGVHMRLKYFLSASFVYFLRERGIGLISQVMHRLSRSKSGT